MPTVSEVLAGWAATIDLDNIPKEFVEAAKMDILDILGCGLFGSTLPWVQISAGLVKDWSGKEEATIWGHDWKAPAVNAVLANAHAVNSFEFDDTYVPTGIHPGALVVTSAIASAECVESVTGTELLGAVFAGHEVSARVRAGLGWSVLHGWNSTAICSTFGAAVASAKIMALDTDGIVNAMGIAGPYVGGLLTYGFGAMAKRLVNARSAQGAIMASLLARRGFTGFRDILESPQGGFCLAHSPDCTIDEILEGLGDVYEIRKLRLKKYPCCTSFHAVVDAVAEILDEHSLKSDDIRRVTIRTTSGALKNNVGDAYDNVSSAQMSMEYAVAARIVEGELGIDQYTDERIQDSSLRAMVQRTVTEVDSSLEERGLDNRMAAKAEIETTHGLSVESSYVLQPKKMTQNEVLEKFRKLARNCLEADRVEEIIKIVMNLRRCDDVRALASLLSKDT